jgi:hypothetical protein
MDTKTKIKMKIAMRLKYINHQGNGSKLFANRLTTSLSATPRHFNHIHLYRNKHRKIENAFIIISSRSIMMNLKWKRTDLVIGNNNVTASRKSSLHTLLGSCLIRRLNGKIPIDFLSSWSCSYCIFIHFLVAKCLCLHKKSKKQRKNLRNYVKKR